MTSDQLPKLINARPFAPFTIRTADGQEYHVRHPEVIAYGGGRIAVVAEADLAHVIDLPLVVSIEVPAGGASARKPKKRRRD